MSSIQAGTTNKRAIVSIQHSGTHALMAHMPGDWHITFSESFEYKDVVGHIIMFPIMEPMFTYKDLDKWVHDREVFVPIRDMSALAFSWVVTHGRTKNDLISALSVLDEFIKKYSPTLVDINKIPEANNNGDGGISDTLGMELAELFPAISV